MCAEPVGHPQVRQEVGQCVWVLGVGGSSATECADGKGGTPGSRAAVVTLWQHWRVFTNKHTADVTSIHSTLSTHLLHTGSWPPSTTACGPWASAAWQNWAWQTAACTSQQDHKPQAVLVLVATATTTRRLAATTTTTGHHHSAPRAALGQQQGDHMLVEKAAAAERVEQEAAVAGVACQARPPPTPPTCLPFPRAQSHHWAAAASICCRPVAPVGAAAEGS